MSSLAFSQNVQSSTIQWNCISTFAAHTGTIVDENTKVVSSPEQIVWYDSNNNVLQTLSITSTIGSWSNVSNTGSIVFKISSGTDTGVAEFSKGDGITRIRIHIVKETEAPLFDLRVATFNIQ
jgi:hypothetical protein